MRPEGRKRVHELLTVEFQPHMPFSKEQSTVLTVQVELPGHRDWLHGFCGGAQTPGTVVKIALQPGTGKEREREGL